MQAEDSVPKLRVVGEESDVVADVPRLSEAGVEEVLRLAAGVGKVRLPREEALRLAAEEGRVLLARSVEPALEEILPAVSASATAGETRALLEEQWGAARRRGPVLWGWVVVGSLLLAGAAGWSVLSLMTHKEVPQQVMADPYGMQQEEATKQEEARRLVEAIEKRVAAYLAAATPDGLLEHVRRREQVAPLIKDWYGRHPYRAVRLETVRTLQPISLEMRPYWMALAGTGAGQRILLVEQCADGQVLVDWETDVCYQPLEWDEFVTKRPEGLYDFRVSAVQDTYYSHEFQSPEQFLCLRLTAKGSDEFLFGYVRRGTADEARVREAFAAAGGGTVSMVLKLGHLPASSARRSVSVVSVVATRWCLVN